MDPDLETIREVFPWWPSELEIAGNPGNWLSTAQAFFAAAIVLEQEAAESHAVMHENEGGALSADMLARTTTEPAMFFCMSFALELAIKAALVRQGHLDGLSSGDTLPFDHNLTKLANLVSGLNLQPHEHDCLEKAAVVVVSGKYPVSKRPSLETNGVPITVSFGGFKFAAQPLYQRLIALAVADDA